MWERERKELQVKMIDLSSLTGEISQIVSIQVDISGVHGDGVGGGEVTPETEDSQWRHQHYNSLTSN